jgi:hypothetical protein
MPKPYSVELRERVVSYVEGGRSRRAAAAHFRVSPSSQQAPDTSCPCERPTEQPRPDSVGPRMSSSSG